MSAAVVRDARPADAAAVAAIYAPYVRATTATFEEEPVAPAAMEGRMRAVADAALPWLVAELDGAVVGYAYAAPWKPRRAYRRTVEATVYLASGHARRGIGRALYAELLERLRAAGIRAVLAGIALPNDASVAFHEALGFEPVGRLREVGFKLGRWIDVGYWERLLG